MDDSNKQICRLCLEITPACESEVIDEIKKDTLEFLLINLDFDIGDCAVACSMCLEKLQNCFDFKSRVTTFVGIDMKVDIKRDFQTEMSNENISLENFQVCQLCMLLIKDKNFNSINDCKDGVFLKDMTSNCLPEMDLNTVQEYVICKQCVNNIKRYDEFMKSCKQVEHRIEQFCQARGHGSSGRVNFKDILKFKDGDEPSKPIFTKKECLNVKNDDVNAMKCSKTEHTARIKCEEVDIKEELDNGVEANRCETKRNVGKTVPKGKKHFCPKCPYSSSKSDAFKKHMLTHSDKKVHKCLLCPYVTDAWFSLRAHMTSHMTKGPNKAFGCCQCHYETDYKSNLVIHFLKHKDTSEVDMHKCALCPFKSKYKSTVAKHYKLQHDTNIEMYKCKECSFSTKYSESLAVHQLMHKKPDQVSELEQDMGVKMFKCEECTFSTKHKRNIVRHQLKHKKPQEVPKHKCDKCEYETNYKTNLVRHLLMHEDLTALGKFKCESCPYQAKGQSDLKRHMKIHSDKYLYRCDVCTYSSNINRNLLRHKIVHQKGGETQMYKCELCNYQAKASASIKAHMAKTHKAFVCPLKGHDTVQLQEKVQASEAMHLHDTM